MTNLGPLNTKPSSQSNLANRPGEKPNCTGNVTSPLGNVIDGPQDSAKT